MSKEQAQQILEDRWPHHVFCAAEEDGCCVVYETRLAHDGHPVPSVSSSDPPLVSAANWPEAIAKLEKIQPPRR